MNCAFLVHAQKTSGAVPLSEPLRTVMQDRENKPTGNHSLVRRGAAHCGAGGVEDGVHITDAVAFSALDGML